MVPDNEYGQKALETFTAEVEERGGTVLRSVSYDPAATSFLNEARVLGLKPDPRPSPKKLEKDPTLDHPVIDFDAIFLPDNHRRVPLVVSALAYEEFSLGTFRINRHAKPTYVMGLSGWNNPGIVDKGGQYLINGVFVDAFWMGNEKESIQQFVAAYRESFEKPPNIYDALSYDVIQLATTTLDPNSENRQGVLGNLQTAYIQNPITGGSQFAENRDLDRVFDVLVIKRSGIKIWEAPENPDKEKTKEKENNEE